MKKYLIDTDILSMFFRNNEKVIENFNNNFNQNDKPNISILTTYEVISGLTYKDNKKQIGRASCRERV